MNMRDNLNDLRAFLAVAEERSFTRAAGKLGVSQSALSHAMRGLEERLGIRLLMRTTRSVSPTEAGERLAQRIGPHFVQIETELAALTELRAKPAGTVRITASDDAIKHIVWPQLAKLLPAYPDIKVELSIEPGLTDIVTERYDAGIRLGEQVAKDMISVPVGPEVRFAVVGSRSYFDSHPVPRTPQDLLNHNCITFRQPTRGGIYAWEFEKGGRELRVRVQGQAIFNSSLQSLDACLSGAGLAHMPEELAHPHIAAGRLKRVLEDWCPYWSGFHLYYPSRRQSSPAFALVVDALRYRR